MKTNSYSLVLCLTCTAYIIMAILSFIAYYGDSVAFPLSYGEIREKYIVEITPMHSIFTLWCVTVVYQLAWLIYSVTTMCRSGYEANIQSTHTVSMFLMYTVTMMVTIFVWTRGILIWSLVFNVLSQYFLNIGYGYACADLLTYLDRNPISILNNKDVWCHRFLIQNGLMFNVAWNTIVSLISMATFICYELEVDSGVISLVTLAMLGVCVIAWFVIENTVLKEHTQFTFTNYIVLIGSLIAIHKSTRSQSNDAMGIPTLVIGLLAITCCLFFIRLIALFVKSYEKRQPSLERVALTGGGKRMAPDGTNSTSVKVYRSFTPFEK